MHWTTTRHTIDLTRPRVMGIVNVTPDSFSDGGRLEAAAAIAHAEALVREGADLLDLGAESTRPGAEPVPADEEWRRLAPVLDAALTLGVPVSIDTMKPAVMRRALDAGADIVNDIAALREPGAVEAVAAHPRAGVCLMHMQGEPRSMQRAPHYDDVVAEVQTFLRNRIETCVTAGIVRSRLVVDPGYGFGKTPAHNLTLLAHQAELQALQVPVLAGWSRKSTLGAVTGRAVDERLAASVAAGLIAVQRGARIVRVHDVAATVDALRVWRAVEDAQ
jgi:dihydropteroate synthase